MLAQATFRVLGEQSPRLEHRHGDRWIRMDRTIPMLTDRQPRSYRGTWKCPSFQGSSSTSGGRPDRGRRVR